MLTIYTITVVLLLIMNGITDYKNYRLEKKVKELEQSIEDTDKICDINTDSTVNAFKTQIRINDKTSAFMDEFARRLVKLEKQVNPTKEKEDTKNGK